MMHYFGMFLQKSWQTLRRINKAWEEIRLIIYWYKFYVIVALCDPESPIDKAAHACINDREQWNNRNVPGLFICGENLQLSATGQVMHILRILIMLYT